LSSNNGTTPHTILSNVISAYKSKFSKSASAPAPSTSSNASATSSGSSTSPAVIANVNATSYMLSSTSGDSNTSSHHILSELISEHTDKQHKHDATTTANTSATAIFTADGGDDYYSAPCSSGPVPSQYEAFEEVSILLCIEKFHEKICMPVCLPATSCLLVTSLYCIHNALQYSNPVMPCIQCCACKGVMPTFCR
jgi:hypothetical protein